MTYCVMYMETTVYTSDLLCDVHGDHSILLRLVKEPHIIIADSGLSGTGRDWNEHYVIYLMAWANFDDVIIALIQWILT